MKIDDYTYSITQANLVICSLEDEVKERIPQNVVNFFSNNSDMSLINNEFSDKSIMFDEFSSDTLKFLKVIDYYINN